MSDSQEAAYCTVQRWLEISGIGRSKTYQLIAEGRLVARKCGVRTLLCLTTGRAYLDSLPRLASSKNAAMMGATTAWGVPAVAIGDAASRLAAVGLHGSSPKHALAVAAVRAAQPARRHIVTGRFAVAPPRPVALPALDPGDCLSASLGRNPARDAIDGIAEALETVGSWNVRAELLREFLRATLAEGLTAEAVAKTRYAVTVVLEMLGDGAVRCLPQAVFFQVCLHPTWRAAATEYLRPWAATWQADYLRDRPDILALVNAAAIADGAAGSVRQAA